MEKSGILDSCASSWALAGWIMSDVMGQDSGLAANISQGHRCPWISTDVHWTLNGLGARDGGIFGGLLLVGDWRQ
jgi:hypothetical protein